MWHATFLALTVNFVDIDTIIPSMLLQAGGTAFHVGLLTAIMVGGARLFQLLFAGFISNKEQKKGYLLAGINLRIVSLFGLALLLVFPMIAGAVLTIVAFNIVFTVCAFFILFSFLFIPRMDCSVRSPVESGLVH